MRNREWGSLIAKILLSVKNYGPMTRAEIEENIGVTKHDFGGCMSRLCRETVTMPQRLHICGYTHDHEGARNYLRPIYAYGPGENKPKPKINKNQRRAANYREHINRVRNASVFNLSLSRNDVRQMKKNVRPTEVHLGQGS